jgi:hypothetical protein
MKTPTDTLLPTLANWELEDLRELQSALVGLIEAFALPSSNDADAVSQGQRGQCPTQGGRSAARGHIETKYIPRGNKRHGPYLYLRYWQDGKLRSKYLGKPSR